MKFANLKMAAPRNSYNIGDAMQIIAIANLYKTMGVLPKNLIRVSVSKLSSYRGEKLVLPINYPMFGYYDLSPDIIPVYLGVSMMTHLASTGLRMEKYFPVGCRDDYTYKELKQNGVACYYAGCLSLTFPKRSPYIMGDKVLLVDVPSSIFSYIPDEIQRDAEILSHVFYDKTMDPERMAHERLLYYADSAKLIVTSRIHCAMPAIAMGIPTIYVCEHKSFRCSVVEQFIPVYTHDKFSCIDWNPQPVEYEQLKMDMLDYAMLRVKAAMYHSGVSNAQHHTYQVKLQRRFRISSDEITNYENVTVSSFLRYLTRNFSSKDQFRYILWGVTQISELAFLEIQKSYPNAILVEVVDEFRDVSFHGKKSLRPEVIVRYPDAIIFITAGAAGISAHNYLTEIGHNRYCICYDGLHIEDGCQLNP